MKLEVGSRVMVVRAVDREIYDVTPYKGREGYVTVRMDDEPCWGVKFDRKKGTSRKVDEVFFAEELKVLP